LLHSTVERLPNLDGEREAIMRRPHGTVMPIIDTEPMRGLAIVLSDWFREAWLTSGNPAGGYFTVQSVAFASCGIYDAAQNAVVASYQQPDRTTGPQSRFRIALSKETEAWITLLRGARAQAIRLYYATFVALSAVHMAAQLAIQQQPQHLGGYVLLPPNLNGACSRVIRQLNKVLVEACESENSIEFAQLIDEIDMSSRDGSAMWTVCLWEDTARRVSAAHGRARRHQP
jgi:hypothetical protein